MFIIAGLGNPTAKYEGTRHNAGFSVVDVLADKYDIHVTSIEHKALAGKGMIGSEKVILVKPQTYMNLSGDSIREFAEYYKIDVSSELIVISDDVELPVGYIRVRERGSAGGHNGLKSIIENLGTERFRRVRVGVGKKPEYMDLADHVLGHIPPGELDTFREGCESAASAVELLLEDRLSEAMNRYNRKVETPKPEEGSSPEGSSTKA